MRHQGGHEQMIDCVFDVGTLMRGFRHHRLLGDVVSSRRATTSGTLFHVDFRRPALLDKGDGRVWGELHQLRDPQEVLRELDELNGFTEYDPLDFEDSLRIVKDVQIEPGGPVVQAYCYVLTDAHEDLLARVGKPIPSGDWRRFLVSREYSRVSLPAR